MSHFTSLDDLLTRTSRTFALAIPLLPEPLDRQVGIAYLLFRIADSIEDATAWTPQEKQTALAALGNGLARNDPDSLADLANDWQSKPTGLKPDYDRLMACLPEVNAALREFSPARPVVVKYLQQTIEGMQKFVERSRDGGLVLASVDELGHYCYIVAGLVGEMLTELFVLHAEQLGEVAAPLHERAARFGEGLQLVNILQDSERDAASGRYFISEAFSREAVFALAREDLDVAQEYVEILAAAESPAGMLRFARLPLALARETLSHVERAGPGAKIGRGRVRQLLEDVLA